MDRRFLNHYNIELQHLRSTAAEFANQFPKVAGRLALDRDGKEACADPFVERLLEGVAYLSARVQTKLDAEFPRFTQTLLETVYPHYLAPVPSMAVVRFEVANQPGQIPDGFSLARGTKLRSILGRDERTACEYRTAHELELWPIEIIEAQYHTRDVGTLDLPKELGARAAIRIRLKSAEALASLSLDRLTFFLRGADEVPVRLYEQIFARGRGVAVRPVGSAQRQPYTTLPAASVRRVGFREDEAMLPADPRGFSGYGLLREYFAFPQRFLFVEVSGLNPALRRCEGDTVDLVFPLGEPEIRLENRVDASCFELFCVPVVNLFPKRTDRVALSNRFSEFHIVADKTRPLDFEIYRLESVTGYGSENSEGQEFKPFYLAQDSSVNAPAFFTTHRVPRVLTEKEQRHGGGSSYGGSEVYISLVDPTAAPYRTELQELGIAALCTNRHLPLQMTRDLGTTDFTLEENAPILGIRCLSGPTAPRPSNAEGNLAWRTISHLALNYLSLVDLDGERGAVPLRDILSLYCSEGEMHMRREIEGLVSARAKAIVRRVEREGPIAFARGLEVAVKFNETAFEGSGVFILGAVLEQFFARYVSMNSFTETVIETEQRGEIMRWPPQLGRKPLI